MLCVFLSAGVGRTGVFIALDHLIQHIRDHDFVDIYGLVAELRSERMCMVQNLVSSHELYLIPFKFILIPQPSENKQKTRKNFLLYFTGSCAMQLSYFLLLPCCVNSNILILTKGDWQWIKSIFWAGFSPLKNSRNLPNSVSAETCSLGCVLLFSIISLFLVALHSSVVPRFRTQMWACSIGSYKSCLQPMMILWGSGVQCVSQN